MPDKSRKKDNDKQKNAGRKSQDQRNSGNEGQKGEDRRQNPSGNRSESRQTAQR